MVADAAAAAITTITMTTNDAADEDKFRKNTTNKKDDEEVIKELTSIRGIGKWTAKMYLLFVLDRQDILPIEDGAFLQSYKCLYKKDDISKISIGKKCKKWKPYSSVAARYLYRALDIGMTKLEFDLYKDLLYCESEYLQ